MKMSKEDKIRIIMDAFDEVIIIPKHKEERVKDAVRNALRTIDQREEERH
jgi:translation initiation factor 6 (eIF-6)